MQNICMSQSLHSTRVNVTSFYYDFTIIADENMIVLQNHRKQIHIAGRTPDIRNLLSDGNGDPMGVAQTFLRILNLLDVINSDYVPEQYRSGLDVARSFSTNLDINNGYSQQALLNEALNNVSPL